MTQLTKFMMYHHGVFGGGRRKHCHTEVSGETTPKNSSTVPPSSSTASQYIAVKPDNEALARYAEAAEKVLLIVNTSADEQVKYVNPFLANAIWLAAAVQLVYKVFSPAVANKPLISSNFEVLRLQYKQFVDYWKTSSTLQRNLDCLEEQLERSYPPRPQTFETVDPPPSDAMRESIGSDFNNNNNGGGGGDGGGVPTYPNPQLSNGSDFGSYRANNEGWLPPHAQNGSDGALQAQSYGQPLNFDGSSIQMGETGLGNDPNFGAVQGDTLEVLEGLAFGLDFGTNSDLPGYLTGLLSGGYD